MSLWFRFYTGSVNNAKVQSLSPVLFKAWVNLLCLAKDNGGILPEVSEIAFQLRCGEPQAKKWLDELAARHLFDRSESGPFQPHDWNEHQYISDVSTDRVKRHRETKKKRFTETEGNVSVTPSETEQIQIQSRADTDTENAPPKSGGNVRVFPSARFDEAWDRWPRKIGREQAERDWFQHVTAENETAVFACLERYLASDEVKRGAVRNLGTMASGGTIKPGWIADCARDTWLCEWPTRDPTPAQGQPRFLSKQERDEIAGREQAQVMVQEAKERGEKWALNL